MRSLSLLRAACAIPASFGLAVSLYAAGTDAGRLAEAMWQTSCANHGWVRERLMERMQPYADSCTHTMWFEHCDAAPGSDLRSGEDASCYPCGVRRLYIESIRIFDRQLKHSGSILAIWAKISAVCQKSCIFDTPPLLFAIWFTGAFRRNGWL